MGARQSPGPDTRLFDMFNEMRMASVMCKVAERNALVRLSQDVFHMAAAGEAQVSLLHGGRSGDDASAVAVRAWKEFGN